MQLSGINKITFPSSALYAGKLVDQQQMHEIELISDERFFSKGMGRFFTVDVYLPVGYQKDTFKSYPVLFANDGQDMAAVKLRETLYRLQSSGQMQKIIVVAIHADSQRRHIYGVASQPNYRNFGAKAAVYSQFIIDELMPHIATLYRVKQGTEDTAFAGFSLGGLAAFDMVWNNPGIFGKVGVFSGSFWWRSKGYDEGYTDADRIMHAEIRTQSKKSGLNFWLQTGTNDETSDRDRDGVIDSIGDTLDIIRELLSKGYTPSDIRYLEIPGGEHNQATWALAMPDFLLWAWGEK